MRDALRVDWHALAGGRWVYLNPPYLPTAYMTRFLAAAVSTAQRGSPVCALLPASPGTRWWRTYVTGADVEFLEGRLIFEGPHSSGRPARSSSALVLWKPLSVTAPAF